MLTELKNVVGRETLMYRGFIQNFCFFFSRFLTKKDTGCSKVAKNFVFFFNIFQTNGRIVLKYGVVTNNINSYTYSRASKIEKSILTWNHYYECYFFLPVTIIETNNFFRI